MSSQVPSQSQTAVLVTGGAGFIGSHLVDALLADGNRVVVVDDLSSGEIRRVPDGSDFHRLDIVDGVAFDALVDDVVPSAIFHLAAQSSVTVSVKDPARDCAVNVQGTLNVLQAATRHRAPVVFTSTGGALYGNDAPIPTKESRSPAPLAPYGASKWAGEAYLKTWSAATGVPHAVCRLGNVYGPRQSSDGEAGVVAIFTGHLFAGRSPRVFGYGKPTRDYVHVSDVVAALRAASGTAGTFNVATGVETEVLSVWKALCAASGASVEPDLAPLRTGELERSCMDPTKARLELGWSPRIPLEEGLRQTYEALVEELAALEPASTA
jgi:UDP-glucose 4-epimerase